MPAWLSLSEDQKETFRAHYETVRRAAWAEHETQQAEQAADAAHVSPPNREPNQHLQWPYSLLIPGGALNAKLPRRPDRPTSLITGPKVFMDEMVQQVEFEELMPMWDALTNEQRLAYNARATALNNEAEAAFQVALQNYVKNEF
jgi:hypothetical protein